MATLESLSERFPLTFPLPNPTTHPTLLVSTDLHREEDLLRNPQSFKQWWAAIHTTRDTLNLLQKAETPPAIEPPVAALLGPLASPTACLSLQRLTYLYEAALVNFPNSFKLWKSYLQMRMSFVLGKLVTKKRAGGAKKFPEMMDALEDEKAMFDEWEGGLDGVVGWNEWKSLIATFERALMWLPNLPRLWLMYLSIFFHSDCPPTISHTHARRTFDRALRTLPPSLHQRIWVRYLLWAESKGGPTLVAIYRRYLAIDPSVTEHYSDLLLRSDRPRPLEAAKLLLSLARRAAKGEYTSPDGKSPYQLLLAWLDVVEANAEAVGLGVEDLPAEVAEAAAAGEVGPVPSSAEADPADPEKLNVERIIHHDGLAVYKDQAGRLWTGLATYWIKRGEFERAQKTFEAGITSAVTVRDFTQIFDAYAEFSESAISGLMEMLEEPEDDDIRETELELDTRVKAFEELMDRRPFLVNDVLIRRNPNDVHEWEKRVALWGDDDEKVVETYTRALETVSSRRASANFHRLWINFAKFYEEGGASGTREPDLDTARKVFERATKVSFRGVDELAEVWIEWAEMELRAENYEDAIRVMQRAAVVPKNPKAVSYHDNALSVQARLFKSLKLWSFYVDLEESIGTVETTKAVYDKILELRIANAQIIINYAAFLEENKYFEESFKVYERGVELFTFPVSFEIWNIYLAKFMKRYGGSHIERSRDLFEQALEKCPAKSCKPLFLMYAQLEEEHGMAKRAMNVYDRAVQSVADEDKFELFTIYIAKATANYGLPATRPIYERALEVLPDRQTAQMCLRFASLERKLGEIDRARAVYAHASQFCDPRVDAGFWAEWNAFEIETGSEDTFREMLRIKRSVQAKFNTEASYLAAKALAQEPQGGEDEEVGASADAMAAAEKAAGGKGMAFVAAKNGARVGGDGAPVPPAATEAPEANADEIQMSDDED